MLAHAQENNHEMPTVFNDAHKASGNFDDRSRASASSY
jgi:hypothetical protein